MQIAVQFLIAVVIGCAVFIGMADHADYNPKVPLIAALVAGVGGQWVVVFLYVWARFGWAAARSMRMYGND